MQTILEGSVQTVSDSIFDNQILARIPEDFVEVVEESEEPRKHLWTKEEYHRLAELGFFEGKRVEFIKGEILEMGSMNTPHATSVRKVNARLNRIFGEGYVVDVQMPFDFGKDYEPIPDVAVLKGEIDDFSESHPNTAVLLVEVSDTTLRYDRTEKAVFYAQNGVSEYWVVNIKHRRLEVYRRPTPEGYADISVFSASEAVSPLASPDAKIKVADLLP